MDRCHRDSIERQAGVVKDAVNLAEQMTVMVV